MMYEHYNGLNPLQHELLTKLLEESSEVSQAIAKTFLHGLESSEPGCGLTNHEKIHNELGDLIFFIEIACKNGLLSKKKLQQAAERRSKRTNHYLHHTEID